MMSQKFSKILIRIIAIIIAGVLLISTIASILAYADSSDKQGQIDEANANISALEEELSRISAEKEKYEAELAAGKKELKDAKAIKNKYDKQMNTIQSQIDTTQSLINQYDVQISNYNSQIAETEESIDTKLDVYYARARANFEEGTANYLEILLSSESISDFLARLEIIESITAADNAFISGLRDEKQMLTSYKAGVEQSKAEQQTLLNNLSSQKAELNVLVQESGAIVAEIEDGVNATIAQVEAAEKAWEEANKKLEAEIARKSTLEAYVGGNFLWPTAGIYKISCKYGPRIHPITKKNSTHHGVDIAAPMNTPILAANSGKVITATYSSVYGNYVVIDHGAGTSTLYAHMTKYKVKVGDTVTVGDTIGYVGSTGWSTGAHLHFEIRIKNSTTDPLSHYPNIKFKFV